MSSENNGEASADNGAENKQAKEAALGLAGAIKGDDNDLLSDLKGRTRLLLKKLDDGDYGGASQLILKLNATRDESLYHEVGKLTRGLHNAIMDFHVDIGLHKDAFVGDQISEMADASSRLNYVITLTEDAANKTMDRVDECAPITLAMAEQAKSLQSEWSRLIKRDMQAEEFRDLYKRIDEFLGETADKSAQLNSCFTDILMAQGYQDLSGQVIKRVIALVQEVEGSLVRLVRVASNVEAVAGFVGSVGLNLTEGAAEVAEPKVAEPKVAEPKKAAAKAELNVKGEGPQVKAKSSDDVVTGQDEVDDLLSSLGF